MRSPQRRATTRRRACSAKCTSTAKVGRKTTSRQGDSTASLRRNMGEVPTPSAAWRPSSAPAPPQGPMAAPQLASCASSQGAPGGRPRAARHSQGGPRPLGSQPRPQVLELAASKVAPFTAFDHLDSVWSYNATFCILGAVLCSAPLQLTCLAKGWCSMVKVPTSAVPERGSCGSSGRAWRL